MIEPNPHPEVVAGTLHARPVSAITIRRTDDPPLFPASVSQHTVRFTGSTNRHTIATRPAIELPAALAAAVPRRRAEFLAGRYCVREALRNLSLASSAVVDIGPAREPRWPPGVVGSITHTADYASAAVARAADVSGLGIDHEELLEPALALEIAGTVAADWERAALLEATGWSLAEVMTLLFSATETIFKCLYGYVHRYFDFRNVAIDAIEEAGQFHAQLLVPLSAECPTGTRLSGRFVWTARSLSTGMLLSRG